MHNYALKLNKTLKVIILSLESAAYDLIKHDGIEHAGYLSFITLLSLFPFLFVFTAISNYVTAIFDTPNLGQHLFEIVLGNIPADITRAFTPRIHEIISTPVPHIITMIILGAIWTASSILEGLRTILNRAYRVVSPPIYVLRRLLSIAQFVLLIFILIVLTIAFTTLSVIHQSSEELQMLWPYLRYLIIPFVLFAFISTIYMVLPNVKQRFTSTAPGAILVVLLWDTSITTIIGYIQSLQQFTVIYGSIGGNILFLLFFYILHICLIYGAEFNYALHQHLHRDLKRN